MRALICVEGSTGPAIARLGEAFERLWCEVIGRALGPRHELSVLPISKANIVAGEGGNIVSGHAPFQILLADAIAKFSPDAVLIVWDLLPPWDSDATPCRWDEMLRLLDGIARDEAIPDKWQAAARAQAEEYRRRVKPRASRGRPIGPNSVELACMQMEFETLFLMDEAELKRALGLAGRKVKGWPPFPKRPLSERKPKDVLAKAVLHASEDVRNKVRGDLRTNLHGWEAKILETLLSSQHGRKALERHPGWKRLMQLLAAPDASAA